MYYTFTDTGRQKIEDAECGRDALLAKQAEHGTLKKRYQQEMKGYRTTLRLATAEKILAALLAIGTTAAIASQYAPTQASDPTEEVEQ